MIPGTNEKSRATLAILGCTFLWGTFWIPLRYLGSREIQGIWPAVTFSAAGGAVFLAVLLLRRRPIANPGRLLLTGIFLGNGLFGYGSALVLTSVVKATLLFYLTPVWGTAIGILFLKEPLTLRRLAAIAAGLAGLFTVLGGDSETLPLPSNTGDWLALSSGIAWSYGCYLAFTSKQQDTIELSAAMSLGSLILAAVFIAVLGVEAAGEIPPVSAFRAVSPFVFALVAVHFVPMMMLTLWGTPRLPPARVGILLMLEVVIAVGTAAVLTDTPFGIREFAGTFLVLAAGVIEVSGGAGAATRQSG